MFRWTLWAQRLVPTTLLACAVYLKDPNDQAQAQPEAQPTADPSCMNLCEVERCVDGRCTPPPPCENGSKDGTETDVDCGGDTCHPCAGGSVCIKNEDCFDKRCTAGLCHEEFTTITFAPVVSYPASFKPYVVVSADFNGDGKPDLAVANELDTNFTIFLGKADGTFTKLAKAPATGDFPTGATATDFNRDGKVDLVTSNFHGDDITILLGDGQGGFASPVHYPVGGKGSETQNLDVGDFNGDGIRDVVATNPNVDTVSVFLGRGDGTMAAPSTLTPGGKGSRPFSVSVGDFNGDSKDDIAVALFGKFTVNIFLGNGDGTFRPDVSYPAGGVGPYSSLIADMNLDGVPDVVLAVRGGDSVSVLLGKGDGTFRRAAVSPTGPGTGPT